MLFFVVFRMAARAWRATVQLELNLLSNKVPPSHRTVTNQYAKHLLIPLSESLGFEYYIPAM